MEDPSDFPEIPSCFPRWHLALAEQVVGSFIGPVASAALWMGAATSIKTVHQLLSKSQTDPNVSGLSGLSPDVAKLDESH
jgi:hypothetical protein